MRIGRVVGNLVSTVKDGALRPYKLLVVEYLCPLTMEPEGEREIATDCVCAGVGDIRSGGYRRRRGEYAPRRQ